MAKIKNWAITERGVLYTPDVILVIHRYESLNTAGVACEWGIALGDTPSVHLVPEQVVAQLSPEPNPSVTSKGRML